MRELEIALLNRNHLLSISIISTYNRKFVFYSQVMILGSRDFHIAKKTFDRQ